MLGYLLAEKNFVALKEYVKFLNDLPPALAEINRFSDSIARQGYTLLPRTDTQALIHTARSNAACWRAVGTTVKVLGCYSAKLLLETDVFIKEFRTITSVAQDRRLKLSTINVQRFTAVQSGCWGKAHYHDVVDVVAELISRLGHCQEAVADLKTQVAHLATSIHDIFFRFIDSLTLPLSTESPESKIEAYYVLGRLGLPGMGYDLQTSYSEEQRRTLARAHVAQLLHLHRRCAVASSNLNDFCYRWVLMLEQARRTLRVHYADQPMVQAGVSLPLVGGALTDVKSMSDQLVRMAKLF